MDAGKRMAGWAMILVALGLAVAAVVHWSSADEKAKDANRVGVYTRDYGGAYDDQAPDHTSALVFGGIGGLLFLSGVIVLAVSDSPPRTTPPAT